jgi:glycosyltransferase involved in cell wall biosynthesis
VVVEAVRALKAEGRLLEGVVVVLAGDAQGRDDYEASLRQAIRSGGLEGSVRLVGHVEDMPAAFRAADVSVVASIEPEGFGRTSVESQALGCPVIVTSVGALPETVLSPPGHGPATMTGWLVPPGDPKAMADALVAALNLGPAERAALGARARAHACGTFSLEQMRLKTLRVYDEILGTRLAAAYVAARPQIEG